MSFKKIKYLVKISGNLGAKGEFSESFTTSWSLSPTGTHSTTVKTDEWTPHNLLLQHHHHPAIALDFRTNQI